MNTLIKLVIGDWSSDGHGKTDVVFLNTNRSRIKIIEAYKKGTEIVGFDLKKHVCREYEDTKVDESYIEMLENHNIDITDFDDYDEDNEDMSIMPEEFAQLYLEICKLGDPDFNWKITSLDKIDIGGYGLFY